MIYNTWALFIGTEQKVEASGEKQQKKSRRDSFCVTHLYFWLSRDAAVMAIFFFFFNLYSPGQFFPPPNEITNSTNQSAMTDWKEKKKKKQTT